VGMNIPVGNFEFHIWDNFTVFLCLRRKGF